MYSTRGKVIIFSAPSGAGKTTIVKRVLEAYDQLEFSISSTTRPKRPHEIHKKDYYFISEEKFRSQITGGDLLEWEEVYPGRFYGTHKPAVEERLNVGKSVVFDVDVKGGINIKRHYGRDALAIFVMPPSVETLRERLENRGTENPEEIDRRVSKAQVEIADAGHFDVIVVNEDLEEAVKEVKGLLNEFLVPA